MIPNSLTPTTTFGLSLLLLMSSFKASAQGIFEKIPRLSEEALGKLVAHYSTETGLETEEDVVLSWTPMDAKGSLLPGMKLQSTARGQGKPDWISYDSANQSILFDDSEDGADGRYLSGNLSHEATTSMTVFWLGHYAEEAPFASSGTYAYNIGPNHTSHQRDDSGETYIVEQYNGTTYKGDSIQGFDGIPTVWSTVVNGSSHQFYANGINLNMQGDPTYSIPADTSLVVGAYSGSGYDFVGSMRELLIFDVALGDEDRMLVESYLANLIAPQGIFEKIPSLSEEALSKLVAHYSTEAGLQTEENVVLSWTPMDAKGSLLPEMKLQSTARGQGKPDWISYDSANQSILFDDSEDGADGRYLSGSLSHEATTSMTVFWLGHYAEEAPFASSGTYAYNIGPNHTSHQRDDSGETYIVEQYNGTTYKGDSIQGFDGIPTVWSTVVNGSSHQFYANGINLNMQGDPTYSIPADTSLVVGAYSGSGYDFVGSMRELLIFDVALGDEDRMLVESYLANLIAQTQPEESLRLSYTDDGLLLEIPSQHILAQSSNLHDWTVVPYHYRSRTLEVSPTENRLFFKSQETFQTLPSGVVLSTRVASDTFREVQLHLDTGELYFIGEKSHGFDLYTSSGNHLWWCYMNTTSKGSGLLEYVMEHQGQAATDKESAIEAGWHTYTADKYRFLKLEPLEGQKTFVNQEAPQQAGQTDTTRAYSEDYRTIDHETLFFTLYQNSQNGHIYLGAGGDSVERQAGIIPPGDGTPEKDNGLRADIAFRATIELTEEQKMELLHQFLPQTAIHGPEAVAYDYQHPPGL